MLRTILPARIVKFIEVQIGLHSQKTKGKRYSPEAKAFALSLYHISGKAYRMLSKLFYLPSKSTLLKWVSGLPNCPGLTQQAMHVIESKVKAMSQSSRQCTISLDEISIKANLSYDSSKDEIVGLEDFGDGQKANTVANSALVFMARGIMDNWKQPLSYHLVHGACDSSKVKEKLLETIDKVQSIGLKVVAVISDLGSNFQKFVKELSVTPTKPWFLHKGVKILYLFDPPHIIKAVRNNLINYEFHYDGKVASWKDIEALYKRDSELTIRCCPKLSDNHIHPNGFKKMKVKYATQVLSHTVSAAILTSVSLGALPTSAAGTAELISKFDLIFDCLNSSSLKSPKLYRRAITKSSPHIKFMTEMCSFVSSIKVINPTTKKDVTSTLKCLKALKLTMNGTISLWNELRSQSSIKCLYTRRLNQDALENFFGSIRQQGGNADNPTPIQFCRAFRKLFYDNVLLQTKGNCTEDLDAVLVGTNYNKNPTAFEECQSEPFQVDESDYRLISLEENLIGMNAITYVAGYLLKKCLEKHDCHSCIKELINNELDSSNKLFCYFKSYESTKKPFGGLIVPSDTFVKYVTTIEGKFIEEFPTVLNMVGIGKYFSAKLPKFSVPQCPDFPCEYMLKLFVRMRLYYTLKFGNRELSSVNKKNRKYFKITHL